jgi:hypothetical protein
MWNQNYLAAREKRAAPILNKPSGIPHAAILGEAASDKIASEFLIK